MRPSKFLKDRFREFLTESSGSGAVEYLKFDNSTKDSLTGDIDDSSAYPIDGITIPARITFNSSQTARSLLGPDEKLEAVLQLSVDDLSDNGIVLNIGDAFLLPDVPTRKRYVTKIVPKKQVDSNEFLEYLVVVSRKRIGRG
jgi:hypothetical protein